MLLPPSEVMSFTESWQRCTPNNLPNLFYAYNENTRQTERVVSYVLRGESVKKVVELKPSNITILMGCRTGSDNGSIQLLPPFAPMIKAGLPDVNYSKDCFLLEWAPTPPFLQDAGKSTENGVDQIPAEGAYLFILGWLEYQYHQLGTPFEAIAPHLVKRVKSYIFGKAETQKIIEAIGPDPEQALIYIHMGIGIRVQKHPFSFRPILQITKALQDTGNEEDGDGEFFDFSNPCPPRCGGGDGGPLSN